VLVQLGGLKHADLGEVLFDDLADFGNQGRHELAAGLPVAAAGIEDGLELFDEEGDVAAFAEHGGDHSGQCHDPLVVVEVFGVDEDFKGSADFLLGALVEDDVVDGDVHGVVGDRRLDLVGGADEFFRALEGFGHVHDVAFPAEFAEFGLVVGGLFTLFDGCFVFRLFDAVGDDGLVDFYCHDCVLFQI